MSSLRRYEQRPPSKYLRRRKRQFRFCPIGVRSMEMVYRSLIAIFLPLYSRNQFLTAFLLTYKDLALCCDLLYIDTLSIDPCLFIALHS